MNRRTYSAIAGALFFVGTGCGSESGDPAGTSSAGAAGGAAGATGMSGGAGGATGGGGGSGGAEATGSSGGGGSIGAATGGSSGGGGARVGGAAGASGGDGSAGAAGSLGGGGSSDAGGNDAGTTASEGGDGASRTNDGALDGRASDAGDGASSVDDGGSSNLFPCLPPGEEKLIIEVAGTPPLNIMTPSEMTCLSRYLSEGNGSEALLDLQWNAAGVSLFAVVRNSQVVPGQLGTFTPFSILLATGAEAWTSLGNQCRVTLTTSAKIGEMPRGGGAVEDIYKVVGSMTCSAGWAGPSKPGDELRRFEFATRVTFLRTP
jgi:hypothetical protein